MAKAELLSVVIDHLGFLGYSIKKEKKSVFAIHPDRGQFSINSDEDSLLIVTGFSGNAHAKKHRDKYLEFVNRLNEFSRTATFYVGEDFDLVISTRYVGPYDKAQFGRVMDRWAFDTHELLAGMEATLFLK